MSGDTEEMIRARGTPEFPPPYSGDTQLWAEDIDNYLRRRMQSLIAEVADLQKRVKALEPPPPEETNGIARADGTADGSGSRDGESQAAPRTRTELRRQHT